ncbi:MAG: hypothetical protein ACR2JC_15500 [Chloroflexota bacterium]|nr:MAG: hypothetical protein DLM70_17295 [Chloroflexota bacterium]
MKRTLLMVSLSVALLAGLVAPSFTGQAQAAAPQARTAAHAQSHAQIFNRTRFLFDMGVAYYAFHHFVYKPWKAGDFKKGTSHRTRHIVEAGAALLFTYDRLNAALKAANTSNSHVLHVLAKPLNVLSTKAKSIANKLRGGNFSDGEISQLTSSTNSFGKQAASSGYGFSDIGKGVPGFGS